MASDPNTNARLASFAISLARVLVVRASLPLSPRPCASPHMVPCPTPVPKTHERPKHLPKQSLKGVSGEIVILEEAAYCDAGLVSEVVVPLLSMQSSVLLCISTLLDGANHYSKMIALRDASGRPVFRSIQISLVCDACLATDSPELCRHKLGSLPRWISSAKVETVRALLSEDPVRARPPARSPAFPPTRRARAIPTPLPFAGHAAARDYGNR